MTDRLHPGPARARLCVVAACALAVAAVAGCEPAAPPGPVQPGAAASTSPAALLPVGGSWSIDWAGGMAAPPGVRATLRRDAAGIGGDSGCNSYGGTARITPTTLRFTDVTSTLMACLDSRRMDYEGAVGRALAAADGATGVPGGTVTLTAGGTPVARLSPAD